jgi:hypothetical protein
MKEFCSKTVEGRERKTSRIVQKVPKKWRKKPARLFA